MSVRVQGTCLKSQHSSRRLEENFPHFDIAFDVIICVATEKRRIELLSQRLIVQIGSADLAGIRQVLFSQIAAHSGELDSHEMTALNWMYI